MGRSARPVTTDADAEQPSAWRRTEGRRTDRRAGSRHPGADSRAAIESRLTPTPSPAPVLLNVSPRCSRRRASVRPPGIASRRLDHGHARRPLLSPVGKGTPFCAFPRLDARPDRERESCGRPSRRTSLPVITSPRRRRLVGALLGSLMVSTPCSPRRWAWACTVPGARAARGGCESSVGLVFAKERHSDSSNCSRAGGILARSD